MIVWVLTRWPADRVVSVAWIVCWLVRSRFPALLSGTLTVFTPPAVIVVVLLPIVIVFLVFRVFFDEPRPTVTLTVSVVVNVKVT